MSGKKQSLGRRQQQVSAMGRGELMERWGGGHHTRGQEGGREWLALVADAGSSKCSFEKTRLGRKTKD